MNLATLRSMLLLGHLNSLYERKGRKKVQSIAEEAEDGNRSSKMERDGISKSNRKGPSVSLIRFSFGSK